MAQEVEEKKPVLFLDLKGGLKTLERRGNKMSVTEALEKYGNGLSRKSIHNYELEAPKVLKFIYDLCRDTGLTFEELLNES